MCIKRKRKQKCLQAFKSDRAKGPSKNVKTQLAWLNGRVLTKERGCHGSIPGHSTCPCCGLNPWYGGP